LRLGDSEAVIQLPCRIGKYDLQEFLGGGMSHVYRAVDTVIGRTVAIKILTEQGSGDQEARDRFLHEARTAARVSHDNILAVYDFGEDEGKPFMVMEFLRGEDLRKAIQNGHTGDPKNKLRLALQIGRALEFIHQHRITHRDIKPENVYINSAGNVKLMDFGIAKAHDGPQMTRAGFILGTPYYMAPEQVQGREVTPLVDVYAFGVLLFELFAGVKPIQGDSVERIFYAILHDPLDLTPLERSGAPEDLRQLIACATEKDPAARYQSFGEICVAIEKMIRGERIDAIRHDTRTMVVPAPDQLAETVAPAAPAAPPQAAAAPPVLERPRTPRWVGALAAGVIFLGVIAGWFALRSHSHAEPEADHPAAPASSLPQSIETDAGQMVLVPAGSFPFGATKTKQSLPAFYIDRTEVSNGSYLKFCNATGHAIPKGFVANRPELPVVNVTIDDARQFAAWAGKRLPTVQEWEKAARGTDGRIYPWGDQASAARANVESKSLVAVDSFADGTSPYGALQMCGNAWELIDGSITPSPQAVANFERILRRPIAAGEPWVAIRGGSFEQIISDAVTYDSASIPAAYSSGSIGFRCVRDATGKDLR
jgi:formylglycine-generating enzyme required for sulfatase activity